MIHVICPNPALDRTIFLKHLALNGVSRAQKSIDLLGGKGFNVIRSFLMEDQPEFLVHSFLGGYTGDYLESMVQEKAINHKTTRIQGKTRICTVVVDEKANHAHLINEGGPAITEDEKKAFIDGLEDNLNTGDLLIFSGSLPQGMEDSFYYELIKTFEEKGARCILDSSGSYLDKGAKAEPWLVKVNQEEFYDLIGKEKEEVTSIIDELENLSSKSNFIITLGSEGSIAKFDEVLYEVKLPKINAKNATASGDIFLGALAKTLDSDRSVADVLRTASAYALSNCLYWYPNIESSDVSAYKNKIEIIIKE